MCRTLLNSWASFKDTITGLDLSSTLCGSKGKLKSPCFGNAKNMLTMPSLNWLDHMAFRYPSLRKKGNMFDVTWLKRQYQGIVFFCIVFCPLKTSLRWRNLRQDVDEVLSVRAPSSVFPYCVACRFCWMLFASLIVWRSLLECLNIYIYMNWYHIIVIRFDFTLTASNDPWCVVCSRFKHQHISAFSKVCAKLPQICVLWKWQCSPFLWRPF